MLNLLQLLSFQMERLPENTPQSCETNSANCCFRRLTFIGCAHRLPEAFALVSDVRATWTFPHFSFETVYTKCKLTGTAVCLSVASMILSLHSGYWNCAHKLDNTKWLDLWRNCHMCPTLSWRAEREMIFYGD